MRKTQHIYSCDTIVVGGDLNAKLYAYANQCPCVCFVDNAPFRFDMLQHKVWLGPDPTHMLQVWEQLNFILGLSGQMPLGNKTSSLNIRDHVLKVATTGARVAEFKFNKLIIFDDRQVFGLPPLKEQKVGKSRVIDWFDVRFVGSSMVLV